MVGGVEECAGGVGPRCLLDCLPFLFCYIKIYVCVAVTHQKDYSFSAAAESRTLEIVRAVVLGAADLVA